MLTGNPNLEIQVKFTLSRAASKIAILGFGLCIDKDIFAVYFIDDSCCEHLLYYLQLREDNSQ